MNIGKRLKKYRNQRGLSQKRLSNHTGISQSFISSIESNKQSPTITTLERICRALGITIAEFFSEADNAVPDSLRPLLNNARQLSPTQREHLSLFLESLNKNE
ncbi:helix-turn-helix protein [Halanaerobium saccharolyticum]|uniref:Helix-turn-helix protein n=1 Tax=Halanaerobium saccharolyticum TaxID=43595 RepID=A0A4R6LRH4_9FIRM|nr:helix-turn-helix transcriptional regulator [Halanaerobium saccharolyticum]TDO90061.1 helix-turn-helix protein [Halanaerobium saccharolyticum]